MQISTIITAYDNQNAAEFRATEKLLEELSPHLGEAVLKQVYYTSEIIVEEMHMGPLLCATALLYRPVQYGYLSLAEVENIWGETVTLLVEGVVKIARLSKANVQPQADSFIGLVLKLSRDPRAILVMLAEQLNKMRTYDRMDVVSQHATLDEVGYLYAPIAHRLGLYTIKAELEEQWMKHAHSKEYCAIVKELASEKEEREAFITQFITPIKAKLAAENMVCEVKGRPKSIHSIWRKMEAQKVGVDGVYDKFAIRIILDEVPREKEKELCWKCYSLVTEEYRPFPKRLRDWISMPKSSGYESLHSTVETHDGNWVEVQIRTRRMDDIAEYGQAAHWHYKEGGNQSNWLAAMREALATGDEKQGDSTLKRSLYQEGEIFVFTPTDDIKQLRSGASVLDFAFAVHTNVGMRCSGARVNGEHVSIKHKLQNGDVVEIQTSAQQKPSQEWLALVQSSRAKTKIRRALKQLERPFAELGKEVLQKKLERLKLTLNTTLLSQVLHYYKFASVDELYEKIGRHELDLSKIKEAFVEEVTVAEEVAPHITARKRKSRPEDTLVIDENHDQVMFAYAKCCNPVRGDDIFGFVTVNKGVRIHTMGCPNRPDLLANHSERIVDAAWTRKSQEERFTTKLVCVGDDSAQFMSFLSPVLKAKGVLLQNFTLNPTGDGFEAELTVEVRDTEQLLLVKDALVSIKGVVEVY